MSDETKDPEWFFSDPEKADALVAEARSWFGTRFHFYSRMKGAGVDCVGFCEEVTAAVGLERWSFERKPDDYSRHVERNTIVKLLRGQEHHPAAPILAARWAELPVSGSFLFASRLWSATWSYTGKATSELASAFFIWGL